MTILDEILAHKALEIADLRRRCDAEAVALEAKSCERMPLGFRKALRTTTGPSIIGEIKRRSPSRGLIRKDFDPASIAQTYAEAGAACISVLTDARFFGGSLGDLERVREVVGIPLLRKDFVIDPIQIDEARIAGADAVLLIVAALDGTRLAALHDHARGLGLDVLVEVHSDVEFDRARAIGADLIGINNRDLRSFEVDLGTTERIATRVTDADLVLVAESGIATAEDVARLEHAGAAGFLVGESLMRHADPGEALRDLRRRS